MKDNKSAILLAVGLLALGLALGYFIKAGLSSIADNNHIVTVRGLSEREVEANKVTWPVVYKVIANDPQELYSRIESGNASIIAYLTKNGLTEKDYTVSAPNIIDKQAERYSSENQGMRYTATSGVIVTSDKVELVRRLIQNQGELLKQGVAILIGDYEYQTVYEYTGLNDIKPEMIADATKKAHEAAEKFAADSGSKVGKLISASQGQFSIEDRDPYTPFIKKVRVVTSMAYAIDD